MMYRNTWIVVKVKPGTPLICTPEIIQSSREHHGKHGYSFKREVSCEQHSGDWIDLFNHDCPDCHIETVTYTEEEKRNSAIDSALGNCSRHYDSWVIDGDTLEVISAFHTNIERLI